MRWVFQTVLGPAVVAFPPDDSVFDVAVRMTRCVACGTYAWCEVSTGVCVDGCDGVGPALVPRCDCGAAAADPHSTRRDGGPGHADYCTVRGRP